MTAPAIDSSVLMLRALLNGDMDVFRRLHAGLNSDERRVFAALLTATFDQAVNDKFGQHHGTADIIEFVANARAQYVGPETVSAEDAEHVIQAALGGEDQVEAMDAYTFGQAQTAMLIAMIRDAGLVNHEINALLDAAAQQVRSFFERQDRR
jgi:hypothetical protein